MVLLLLGKMRSKERGDRMVSSHVWGSYSRSGIPGSKLYVFKNNLKEKEEYLTAKHLAFGVRLPKFKSQRCYLIAV